MNVDHVLYGPRGVVAVETKFTSMTWTARGSTLEGPVGEPLDQALRAARRIRLLLKSKGIVVDVAPALAVWGPGSRALRTSTIGGIHLLVGRQQKEWARHLPVMSEGLSPDLVARIDTALREFIDMRDSYERQSVVRTA
jgi:hypothetical protein